MGDRLPLFWLAHSICSHVSTKFRETKLREAQCDGRCQSHRSSRHLEGVSYVCLCLVRRYFFGYDSGYINGVLGSDIFVRNVEGPTATALSSSHQSLVVSILSAGTFFGALIAGDMADMMEGNGL